MKNLIHKAAEILESNWRGSFTVPSEKLYPFQWDWDSAIVSVGMSHHKLDYAIKEMETLFSGQWENGMIPHILFHSENESSYFPNFDFWNSNVNSGAPSKPKSSGITQPPVHGFVLEKLLSLHPHDDNLKAFAKSIFPKTVKYHQFLYSHRDPNREGLMYIYHPWESGRDNSPLWDESLNRIKINSADLPTYTRKDTQLADPSERPTSDQYDRYVYLLEVGRNNQYEGKGIFEESPFLIQDSMMNALSVKSIESLIEIGKQFNFDTAQLEEWQSQSVKSFDKLWNKKLQTFVPYDLVTKSQMNHKEIGGLTALMTNLVSESQANAMNDYLMQLHQRGYYLCPSFDVDSELFDSKRYWRGPVWPQMNWLLVHGLKRHGFHDTAEILSQDIIEIVDKLGFYEYFESQKSVAETLNKGYGGANFSWTSSCIIDLIKSKK